MSAPAELGWVVDGEHRFADVVVHLTDHDLEGPSLLPGWQRRTVIAHVSRNADALTNLLTWARTGVETPMYPSPEAREADISSTAALAPDRLREDSLAAAGRLADAVADLPPDAWDHPVRTAQGRTIPASGVPWLRCREVWVHAVDLDAGPRFADLPPDVLTALIDDAVAAWDRKGITPDARLSDGSRTWGAGALLVDADLAVLAAACTGRGRLPGAGPDLPPWP